MHCAEMHYGLAMHGYHTIMHRKIEQGKGWQSTRRDVKSDMHAVVHCNVQGVVPGTAISHAAFVQGNKWGAVQW